MGFRRLVGVVLLTFMAATFAEMNKETSSDLDCTNDFEEQMFCQFKSQNCAQHSLTVRSQGGYGEKRCGFRTCDTGRCCCSVRMGSEMLILTDRLNTTLWKGALAVKSRVITVEDSIKTKAPTIVSLREFRGNFQLKWRTNVHGYLGTQLAANVTYYKKGETEKVTTHVEAVTVDRLRYYEIPGRDLEPGTTYVVSVRSYVGWSGKYSDSSEEWEFTTGASPHTVLLAIIVSISVFAVIITGVIYSCYVKLKTKWWDTVSGPRLLIHANGQNLRHKQASHVQVLKPDSLVVSSVDVIPISRDKRNSCIDGLTDTSGGSCQQSSGISSGSGSSSVGYAITRPPDVSAAVQDALQSVFFKGRVSPCKLQATSSPSSECFHNKTYSIVIPGPPSRLPLQASSPLPTDMSYRQCKADSAYAGDSSSSSESSGGKAAPPGDLVCRAEARCGEAETFWWDRNPCSHSPGGPLPVDPSYQAVQRLVTPPDVCAGVREHLDKHPEGSFLGSHCVPELLPPHRPITTNSAYQCV